MFPLTILKVSHNVSMRCTSVYRPIPPRFVRRHRVTSRRYLQWSLQGTQSFRNSEGQGVNLAFSVLWGVSCHLVVPYRDWMIIKSKCSDDYILYPTNPIWMAYFRLQVSQIRFILFKRLGSLAGVLVPVRHIGVAASAEKQAHQLWKPVYNPDAQATKCSLWGKVSYLQK